MSRLALSRVVVLGFADQLKKALVTYTESVGQGEARGFCREIRDPTWGRAR